METNRLEKLEQLLREATEELNNNTNRGTAI